MKLKLKDFYIEIEFLFLVVIFISIFSLKVRDSLKYFYLCYLFMIFHEFSHIFIGDLLGKEVEKINFCMSGVNAKFMDEKYLTSNKINYINNILIYLAGPISNTILAIIFKNIKVVFEMNIFLGIINLLPVYPLDGYNILKCLIKNNKKSNINLNTISVTFEIILVILSVLEIIFLKSFSLSLFTAYLYVINAKYSKRKCYNVENYCQKMM